MYEIFEKLLSQKGVKAADVTRATGVSSTVFSEWKKGKSAPKADKLALIADYFGVTIDFLMGKVDKIQCPECGEAYNPLDEWDCSLHNTYHQKRIEALKKFPFLVADYHEAGMTEFYEFRNFKDPTLSDEERINAFEKYLIAKFSNEISFFGFEIEGKDYETFCNQEILSVIMSSNIDSIIKNALIEKYNFNIPATNEYTAIDALFDRVRDNAQLIKILAYAEMLPTATLTTIEIQLKALAEQQESIRKGSPQIISFRNNSALPIVEAAHFRTDIEVLEDDDTSDDDIMDDENF